MITGIVLLEDDLSNFTAWRISCRWDKSRPCRMIMKVERDEILEELMSVYIDARLK